MTLTDNSASPTYANSQPIKSQPIKHGNVSTVELHSTDSEQRTELQRFIAEKFNATHGASISEFLPYLVSIENPMGKSAGIGVRPGVNGEFFLQKYLAKPIEQLIAGISQAPCDKHRLVEIGNFAADNPMLGATLFSILAKTLQESGFQWMIFTATLEVEKMISYLNCQPVVLGEACASKLGADARNWGNYYQRKPKVMACHLDNAIGIAQMNSRIAKVFAQYAWQIAELSFSLSTAIKSEH